MKGPSFFQGEIIAKFRKYIDIFKKSSSPEQLGQFQPNLEQIILEWREFKFFKSRTPFFQGYVICKIVKYLTISKNLLLQNNCGNFNQSWLKASLGKEDKVCSNGKAHLFTSRDNNKSIFTNFKNLLLLNYMVNFII